MCDTRSQEDFICKHESHEQPSRSTQLQPPPPIAIIGIGLRLPGGVNSASTLWDMLIEKRDGRSVVPANRYNIDAFHRPSKSTGSVASRYGYFLQDNIDKFDTSFFTMSKAEVDKLDPQQRLLLEVVWETMQNGGQTDWRGSNIGCFVGVFGDVS
jgi:acyl transferase domain-containing protein